MHISGRCNQDCIFCLEGGKGAQRGPDPTLAQVKTQLKSLRRQGAGHITFMGSETLFRKDLAEILAAARRLGFTRIGLATNGTALARRGCIAELAECGLEFIEFSIHGHTRELVNRIAGTGFTYDRQLRALEELDRVGSLFTIFNIVVCRENRDHLGEIADFIKGKFPRIPARLKFKFVSLSGRELSRVEAGEDIFTCGMVNAEGLGRRLSRDRIPFCYYNFPLCRLGGYASHSEELQNIATDEQYFDLSNETGGYVPAGRMLSGKSWPMEPCGGCSLRELCPGVETAYLVRGGSAAELRRSGRDPRKVLEAAFKEMGRDVSPAVIKRILKRQSRERGPEGTRGLVGGAPDLLCLMHPEESHSFDLGVLVEKTPLVAGSGDCSYTLRYKIKRMDGTSHDGNPRTAKLTRAVQTAAKLASARGLAPAGARDEILAAAGHIGWHLREEMSEMLVFLNSASPRSLDVQVIVSRYRTGHGTGWKKRFVHEFRNKSFLSNEPRMQGFLTVAVPVLKKASRKGIDIDGACRMLIEAAEAAGWRLMR
jgi:hypothetical protein